MEPLAGEDRRGVRLKSLPIRAGQLVLTILVTWFILDRVGLGLEELRSLDAGQWVPDPLLLVGSALLLLAGYFMSAALWGRQVRPWGRPCRPAS